MARISSLVSGRAGSYSSVALCVALVSGALYASPAFADAAATPAAGPPTASSGPSSAGSGDILVTARRKSENILKTPISISALTAEDLAARGVKSLQDIGNYVPGLNIIGQATTGGRSDRSFVGIVLRGIVPSSSIAQTTSVFIDGAPVSSATALETLNNPARVEVIKGPQSALFGRQTFAGALNVVTKNPSDHLSGNFSGTVGTRANYDASGELSAPLFGDVLGFRASVRAFGKNGSYHNASLPTQTLGDQSTITGSMAIVFRPTSSLTIKAFGLFTELKDGPSAQGVISGGGLKDPSGNAVVIDQHNCILPSGKAFICGVAPGLSALSPSVNTVNTSVITNFLANPSGRVVNPASFQHGYGLVNHYNHEHVNMDWKIGDGLTLSSLTAFNSERKSELADVDNYNGTAFPTTPSATNEGFYNFVFLVEGKTHDFSQELRASFENGGPFHASVGGSYLNVRGQTAAGSTYTGGSKYAGLTQNRTFGAFYALGYDFGRHFSLNADGRYQIDKIYAFAGQGGVKATTNVFVPIGTYPDGSLLLGKTFKNFMPRFIGQYNFDTGMVYASYSKGINPASFNTSFITSPAPVVAAAQALGYKIAVNPEKITNYEVGTKGKLFNGKLHYDVAAFYMNWTDQVQLQSQNIVLTIAPAGPLPYQVVASANVGQVHIKGVEAEVAGEVFKGLMLNASGAFIDSKIINGKNSTTTALTGITNFAGNQNQFTSKYSANIGAEYSAPINVRDLEGYGRVDFIYKSGNYSDIANIARTPALTQFNLRTGLRNKTMSIEGFVTNLFNNKAYYSLADGSIITPAGASVSALIAQLRDLRTFGVRVSYDF
jgi:iron complex outermembrane receptor protein